FTSIKGGVGKEKLNTPAAADSGFKLTYIDLDTINEYYELFRVKNEEIEKEKQRIENEIQSGVNKLEQDRINFLKKGESITQIEAEQFQRDYQNRYQQLGTRRESLLNQHLDHQAKALDEIQKNINDYLKEYNKDRKFHFIFSTGEGNLTLYYKDSAYNITREVLEGLNRIKKTTQPKP
ncbi:MAG: OmpH family outer membrane protein, partial [Chitinophagaceae bacterium]